MSATILSFHGLNRGEAWAEALRLAEVIERYGAAERLRVRAEWQPGGPHRGCGEWVVKAYDVSHQR